MTKALVLGLGSLIAGVAVAMVFGSKVAEYLAWPGWLAFLLVFLDIVFVAIIPFTFPEFTANIALFKHRIPGARESADYPPGCAYFLITTMVIIPVFVFLWLLYIVNTPAVSVTTPIPSPTRVAQPSSKPTGSSSCIVPNMVGQDQATSEMLVTAMGLNLVKKFQPSSIPTGGVISQEPKANTELSPCQGKIEIVVSAGLPQPTVPTTTPTSLPPTITSIPPTATRVPPTSTPSPMPTLTSSPTPTTTPRPSPTTTPRPSPTNTPLPTLTPLADTSPGTILGVGDTWRQGG